ncbi:hypothetical protein CEXT_183791 [Caerostris extrusa]|uniref:Uncharacterized protein n=1 Tax=Caerostris extrusa TaxID=172846 RepID=A0AAV4MG29_CAEEX|nr:hypothetical protein CEXT_183791 [Caerostris extrusa]
MKAKLFGKLARLLERTHSSIQRVINNYTSSKSIISKPRSGRPFKLTAREKRYVFKSSEDKGEKHFFSTLSYRTLRKEIQHKTPLSMGKLWICCHLSCSIHGVVTPHRKTEISGGMCSEILEISVQEDCEFGGGMCSGDSGD